MTGKQTKRSDQVQSDDQTETAILSGEYPPEFVHLHDQLVKELMPDGLLEEDAVLTIANCLWRKRTYQKLVSKTRREGVDEEKYREGKKELTAFHKTLVDGATENEIEGGLAGVGVVWEYHFLKCFPRLAFESAEAWAKAMAQDIKDSLLPHIDKVLEGAEKAIIIREITGSAHKELLERELGFQERNEAGLQRAIDRFFELRAAKPPVSFRAKQRFDRSELDRPKLKAVR